MSQTPVFRNINIFFSYSNVWFLHLHSTKNYTQTCRPAVHNCYDWGRPVVAGRDAGAGKGWIARNSFSFFSFSLSFSLGGVDIHTSCGRSKVCTLFQIPSIPLRPQYTAPRSLILSHFHWIITMHTHTRSITPFLLSLFLSHPRTFFLAYLLVYALSVPIFFFFLLFLPFSHLHSRARSCLSCSHIQQHLNIVFSVIIKRNNDNI